MTDKDKGLYPKYYVEKIVTRGTHQHGEPVQDWVFVLNPTTDPGAVEALRAYTNWAAANGYERLAFDLEDKLEELGLK